MGELRSATHSVGSFGLGGRQLCAALAVVVAVTGTGCLGLIGGKDASGGDSGDRPGRAPDGSQQPLACELALPQVGYRELRRLSPEQYQNTVGELVGNAEFNPEIDGATDLYRSELGTRGFEAASILAASSIDWGVASPCAVGQAHDASCAHAFIASFGRRAFRRPLRTEETEWLEGVYAEAAAEFTFEESLRILVSIMLQSPQFLYLHEEGVDDPSLPFGIRRLNGFERASRLSYFLWNTMPDETLLNAAESGELDTPEGMRVQAERLLADARSDDTLHRFVTEWLDLDGLGSRIPLEGLKKDPDLYPGFAGSSLRAAMREEVHAFVERVMREDDATLEALLTRRYARVTPELADVYGVPFPAGGGDAAWVELPESERAGLFTRAGFLAVHASERVQSPILRGVHLLRDVLCRPPGPPPGNANNIPVEQQTATDELSVRELSDARTPGDCQSCHKVINQLGFALEHYGALGEHQTEDPLSGEPTDATGELVGTDIDGPVRGGVELSARFAQSEDVAGCVASRWIAEALDRDSAPLDRCAEERVREAFQGRGDLRVLLGDIVTSDLFLYRNEIAPEEGP